MNSNTQVVKFLTSAIIALLIIIAYFANSYNSIFATDYGFIYHPESGSLYEVELEKSVDGFEKWNPFIPFKSLFYGQPKSAQFLGEFDSLVKDSDEFNSLSEQEKGERLSDWLNESLDSRFEAFNENLEYLDINFYPRRDVEPEFLLPEQLYDLKVYANKIPAKLLTVDFVLHRWSPMRESNEISIWEKGLYFEGIAARKLVEILLPIRHRLESF